MEEKIINIGQEIDDAIMSDEIPHLYANGFVSGIGTGDITILLKKGIRPVATVNMSYTVAKTLAVRVSGLISSLEAQTGNTIMITSDIEDASKRKGS